MHLDRGIIKNASNSQRANRRHALPRGLGALPKRLACIAIKDANDTHFAGQRLIDARALSMTRIAAAG